MIDEGILKRIDPALLIPADRATQHYLAYYAIIANRLRNPNPGDVYAEKHHILPRALFPKHKKSKKNLVRLTAKEHFIAHFHLAKHFQETGEKGKELRMWCPILRMEKNIRKWITGRNIAFMAKMHNEARERQAELSGCPVLVYDKHGNFIREFKSTMETARFLGVVQSCVGKAIDKNETLNRHTCKGYILKRKTSDIIPQKTEVKLPLSQLPLRKLTKDGVFLGEYPSMDEAIEDSGLENKNRKAVTNNIRRCAMGMIPTAYGFKWEYPKTENLDELIELQRKNFGKRIRIKDPVLRFDTNMNLLEKYDNSGDAALKTGGIVSVIDDCLRGRRLSTGNCFYVRESNATPEYLAKLLSKYQQAQPKPVVQCDLNGNILNVFSSAVEAERKTGIFHNSISKVCLGKRKTAGGYPWKFIDGKDGDISTRNH